MKSILVATILAFAAGAVCAAATVGQPAPAFTAVDAGGKTVSLADFKGTHVVLEWVNPGCPFVQKHYNSGNMQGTQKQAPAKGVVWLAINSTAPDAGDYKAPRRWRYGCRPEGRCQRDADGCRRKVGRPTARARRRTCTSWPRRQAVYAGGIDNKATANRRHRRRDHHVKVALGETLAHAGDHRKHAALRLLDQVFQRRLTGPGPAGQTLTKFTAAPVR